MDRTEYPRPQFVRNEWMNLNGIWDIRFDNELEWKRINVPFAFQSVLSGIGTNQMVDNITYRRNFEIPKKWKGKRIILHFGAVDYFCKVTINGCYLGSHEGGNVPFSFDITDNLSWDVEQVIVEVWDPCGDETIPRGKQYWLDKTDSIWYTRTSGIWQTVWLEPINKYSVKKVKFTPNLDEGTVAIDIDFLYIKQNQQLDIDIFMKDESVISIKLKKLLKHMQVTCELYHDQIFHSAVHNDGWCWSPLNPNLFDVNLRLIDESGKILDSVQTYFGLRKIEAKDGIIYLNNRPYIQKLVLDQGYWRDGGLTAPNDQAFVTDIKLAKQMGFNGCRKHQKCEDPRFLYWADKLGYLVWGEMASCPEFSELAVQRTFHEWADVIERDYNHPSIVTWVGLNESWGVPFISQNKKQQSFALALYYFIKSLDATRLVVSNDGWEITKSDICTIHNYMHGNENEEDVKCSFFENISDRDKMLTYMSAGRPIYVEGFQYDGVPMILSEFGGISYKSETSGNWGYTTVKSSDEFLRTYQRLIDSIKSAHHLWGYCYTQLSDVEQETNGLVTADRCCKVDPEKIKEMNDQVRYLLP